MAEEEDDDYQDVEDGMREDQRMIKMMLWEKRNKKTIIILMARNIWENRDGKREGEQRMEETGADHPEIRRNKERPENDGMASHLVFSLSFCQWPDHYDPPPP